MASTTCSMAVSYMQSTKRFYRPASATQPGLISAAHHQHTRKSLPATISHKTNWSTPDGSGARTFITRNALAGQSQSDNIPTYMAGRRNIIMPVDNSDDSDFAVNWALKHLYKTGDCLHMLYCIPQYQNKMTFNDGEELAHVERQKATKEALRKRFENKFVQFNVPSEDLIYDILEEEHISAGLFGVSDSVAADFDMPGCRCLLRAGLPFD